MDISEIIGSYISQNVVQGNLSEEQKSSLEEILAQYDPENMTEEERQALRSQLEEAGIPRSPATARILREAGFMAAQPKETPDESSLAQETTKKRDNQLLDLIEQYKSGQIDQERFMSLIQEYSDKGLLTTGNLVDETA